MDYEFFHSMTQDEAHACLNGFLNSEKQALEELKSDALNDGVNLDYSLSSLADVLKWLMKRVRVHRIPVPADEPHWIRQAHHKGLIEFDDNSRVIILRAAYYLGECFARLPRMRWTTGNAEYLQNNMPVVAGFRLNQELPPLVVIENVFARILGDGVPNTNIDSTIGVWVSKLLDANHDPTRPDR
jgi:hypothetical protein